MKFQVNEIVELKQNVFCNGLVRKGDEFVYIKRVETKDGKIDEKSIVKLLFVIFGGEERESKFIELFTPVKLLRDYKAKFKMTLDVKIPKRTFKIRYTINDYKDNDYELHFNRKLVNIAVYDNEKWVWLYESNPDASKDANNNLY